MITQLVCSLQESVGNGSSTDCAHDDTRRRLIVCWCLINRLRTSARLLCLFQIWLVGTELRLRGVRVVCSWLKCVPTKITSAKLTIIETDLRQVNFRADYSVLVGFSFFLECKCVPADMWKPVCMSVYVNVCPYATVPVCPWICVLACVLVCAPSVGVHSW